MSHRSRAHSGAATTCVDQIIGHTPAGVNRKIGLRCSHLVRRAREVDHVVPHEHLGAQKLHEAAAAIRAADDLGIRLEDRADTLDSLGLVGLALMSERGEFVEA
jgi:hypothetical protein